MSDRELLELAAKAAGITGLDFNYHKREGHGLYFGPRLPYPPGIQAMCPRYWCPLEDDGDALRLAMLLELGVVCKRESDSYERNTSVVTNPYCVNQIRVTQKHLGDPEAATRRAIVRAAAEIGRAMP
ncbi:hypothetical protein [Pseudomonas sp. RIT-To-2]|uniref:hypothetical protein n=1 Tax=Pseudomonas sp. RIT-To-2 TaxID=3462541 RepID=UPI0024131C4F